MFNKIVLCLILALALAATGTVAKTELPAVSHDGLHLMPNTKERAVYMKPGADLSQYDKITLLKTYVANRVTNTADFDRIVLRWAKLLNSHLAQVKQ